MDTTFQANQLPELDTSKIFADVKNPTFRKIGIMGKAGKKSVTNTLLQLSVAVKEMGLTTIMDDETAALPTLNLDNFTDIQVVKRSLLGEVCDLVVVVGGDGSILHAADALAKYRVPVLGVNRGRLGFLADVNPDVLIDKLKTVLNGNYELDKRFLLTMEIREGNEIVREEMALNDIVLHAGKSAQMIDFHLQIDGKDVYRQHSDGLIVSTPTGSTAYGLSGGGPIIHPSLDTICLVPMHPHTLSSRPIVVSGKSEIVITINKDSRTEAMVSSDGRPSITMNHEQTLHIHKHPDKLTLLHPPGYDFYEACRTKLYWNIHAEEFRLDRDID